jgi:glyoxylase I family protein
MKTKSSQGAGAENAQPFINGVHGARYQVTDVGRAMALSGPGASGSRPRPDGQRQEPGGWNRVVLRVTDLPACIAVLQNAGVRFRNEMETGPGGRQIQIEDPDGDPIELFEPARQPA